MINDDEKGNATYLIYLYTNYCDFLLYHAEQTLIRHDHFSRHVYALSLTLVAIQLLFPWLLSNMLDF